ncbi:hypothetical protein R1sor_001705 [Riccia sorocarpa]|uniref:Uncharacterized protein n=1 Tax=Riccia sorocarpa TaxID=122646 RepID=A0ABD3GX26_9MARC
MERRGSDQYSGSSMPYGHSYSASYASAYDEHYQTKRYKPQKSRTWDLGMSDPEVKRKKRVASYKVFTVEGKVKASVRSGFRWIKNKYIELLLSIVTAIGERNSHVGMGNDIGDAKDKHF